MNIFVERLGWVLVHSLWQFTLVALLAGVTVRVMRRQSASLRYVVLVVAMAVSVSAPLVTWQLQPNDVPNVLASRAASVLGQEANEVIRPEADAIRLADRPVVVSDAQFEVPPLDIIPTKDVLASQPSISPLAPTKPVMTWSEQATSILRPWLAWIVAGWSLGVVLCSLRPLLGWHTLWRLKRIGVSAVSDDVLAAMDRVAKQLGLQRAVSVLQSTFAQVPVVVGYFKPVILLPVSLATSLSVEQLEAILAHELAHVRRHDFVVNLLQTLVETLFFYHPAVWWLSRQIRVEREHCCDDLVVAACGNRVEYGRALLAIEELRGRSTLLALGANDGSLLSRIRRIVGINSDSAARSQSWSARLSSGWLGGLVTLTLILSVSCASFVFSWDKSKETPPKNPFSVAAPDGVEVELLGVSTHWTLADASRESKIERRGWWQPDGAAMTKPPVSGLSLGIPPEEHAKYFDDWPAIAVRIRGGNADEVNNPVIIIDGMREYTAAANVGTNHSQFVREEVLSGGPMPGLKSGIVRVATGGGDYGPWQTTRPNGTVETDGAIPGELQSSYERLPTIQIREVEGQTRLVSPDQPVNYSATRARGEAELIDLDGKPVQPGTNGVVNGERSTPYPIPLARVSHYRVRLRAYRHWFTFENVSFQPGFNTEVKTSVGKTPELRREPFIATLPSGARIEFVGLAPMEEEPKTWWKPNGTPLNDVPQQEKEWQGSQSLPDLRRALIRVHGAGLSFRDVTTPGIVCRLWAESHEASGFGWSEGEYPFRPGQKAGRFEVGVATQPQSPVRRLDAKGRRIIKGRGVKSDSGVEGDIVLEKGSTNEQVSFDDGVAEDIEVLGVAEYRPVQPQIVDGKPVLTPEQIAENEKRRQYTTIRWHAPTVAKPMEVVLELIDNEGRRHRDVESSIGLHGVRNLDGTPHWGKQPQSQTFRVPLSKVSGFEYRVRPYQHWIAFDNVALNPGEMTDVKVSVESVPNSASSKPISGRVPSGEWPMWGGSAQRNHVASGRLPTDWDVESGRNIVWKTLLGTATHSSPVVSGGKVFIGTNNGAGLDPRRPKEQDFSCLICFDQVTGQRLWQYSSEKLPAGRQHDWPNIGLCSTACVVGDRVFVVTNRCEVVCLDTNGFRDGENDGPVVDEAERTEVDADVVWKFDIFKLLGVRPLHQAVSSIAVVDGVVLLNTSNGPEESHVKVAAPNAPNFLALDAATGKVVWQDNSAGESIIVGGSSCGCSGTSPAVATIGGVTQAIFAGREGWLYGFDFADLKRGQTTRLWQFDCNPKTSIYTPQSSTTRNTLVASPVVVGDRVFIATGRNPEMGEGTADLWCIDATKRGDLSTELVFNKSHRNGEEPIPHKPLRACDLKAGDFTRPNPNSGAVWHYVGTDPNVGGKRAFEKSFHRSLGTPVIHDGLLFIADFSGLLHCVDAVTGQGLWTHDLLAAIWSSCVIADGHVLIGDEDGDLAIFKVSRQCEPIRPEPLNLGHAIYPTPALVNDTLFVATQSHLIAIRDDNRRVGGGSPDGLALTKMVSLSVKDRTLEQVLADVCRQAGLKLEFDEKELEESRLLGAMPLIDDFFDEVHGPLEFVLIQVLNPALAFEVAGQTLRVSSRSKIQKGAMLASRIDLAKLAESVGPTLKCLNLRGTRVADDDLKQLAKFPKLERLSLLSTAIRDPGLEHVAQLESLVQLSVGGFVTDAGLKSLAKSRSIRQLALIDAQITDAAAESLIAMPQLESLTLQWTRFGDAGLKQLAAADRLKRLSAESSPFTDAAVEALASCKRLESLGLLGEELTVASLKTLEKMTGLRELSISFPDQHQEDLKALRTALAKTKVRDFSLSVAHGTRCCEGFAFDADTGAPIETLSSQFGRPDPVTGETQWEPSRPMLSLTGKFGASNLQPFRRLRLIAEGYEPVDLTPQLRESNDPRRYEKLTVKMHRTSN